MEILKGNHYIQCLKCEKWVLFNILWDNKKGISILTCPKCGYATKKIHNYTKFENGKLVEYRDEGIVYKPNQLNF